MSKEVQDTEVIKQGFGICLRGQREILLAGYLEMDATITTKYYSEHGGKILKGIMFLQENAAAHKAAITHLKLAVGSQPTHLIWPLWATAFFPTSREERF
jgi:hypothetical protein